nr:sensor histidine kinase [Chitinophagaceae bacterium]
LGNAQVKKGRLNEALSSYLEAQPLREKVGDPFFIVSDQAEISKLYAKLGNTKEGIAIGEKALRIAQENNITAKLPMIYTSLASNYETANDFEKASAYYKKISDLKDSMYADANPQAIAEMRTKYETEKQDRLIEQQNNRLKMQNYLFAGIAGFVLLSSLLLLSWYKRNKLRQETAMKSELMRQQETAIRAVMEAEENERQRIAKDLHDGVGQMMSAAKMNLSAFESELQFDNEEQRKSFEKVINLVDESCREVRTVSHVMMPNALLKNNLGEAIREFTGKLNQKDLKVVVYTEGLEQRLDSNIETMLYRVVQECVNNTIKHAGASTLDISLIRDKDGISGTIEDNGKGFDTTDAEKLKGFGIKNISSRIEYLKGSVDFDSAPGRGTVVALHIPL